MLNAVEDLKFMLDEEITEQPDKSFAERSHHSDEWLLRAGRDEAADA